MRRTPLFLALLAPLGVLAQDMVLSGGSMTVSAGTQVRILSPMTWQLAPGATVVNHGVIDLGTQGWLVEQAGSPITGTGLESATWAPAAPLVDAEPGGLGLRLSSAYAGGGLQVERGHVPRSVPSGAMGIARWYRVSVPQATSASLEATLHYDLTELNGADPSALAIFSASTENGPWIPVISSSEVTQETVFGTTGAPDIHLTAFDLDAALEAASAPCAPWRCWPTVVDRDLWLQPPTDAAIRAVELFDAAGKRMPIPVPNTGSETVRIALPELVPGAYLLRVNEGAAIFRLMKP